MLRKDGEGAVGLLVGAVHVLDEVASEVPVLEPDRVASLLQHPSDPGCPTSISFVEADEEVTLGSHIVCQGAVPLRCSTLQAELQPRSDAFPSSFKSCRACTVCGCCSPNRVVKIAAARVALFRAAARS